MDRKDFLKYGVFMLLGLIGMKSAVTMLTGYDITESLGNSDKGRGFGGGKYGG